MDPTGFQIETECEKSLAKNKEAKIKEFKGAQVLVE
jgi:hypothetical protein